MTDLDNQAARLFEESALVRAIERGALVLRSAAMQSRSIAAGRASVAAATAQPGIVLVAASLTHMLLTAAVTRPAYWQWLILPSIALTIGGVLIAGSARTKQ